MSKVKRVLIIDDSLLVRNVIADLLNKEPDIEVVATGKTGLDCIELATKLKPDFIILDIEMPIMDGLMALDELKKSKLNIPVIMLSVLTQHGAEATFKALEKGAIDFVPKPSTDSKLQPEDIGRILASKIRGYFEGVEAKKVETNITKKEGKVSAFPSPLENKGFQKSEPIKAICIGTSTGGPKALQVVISGIPKDIPVPIFVVQHMPFGFTKAFAERLNQICPISVKEAEDGEVVQKSMVYIAPGDRHLMVQKKGNQVHIQLDQSPQVNGHRPSIDVLFDSVREVYQAKHVLAVIMTGMGRDGARGIYSIKEEGGLTIAQDQDSSVIYGMNRVAVEMGAIHKVIKLNDIPKAIVEIIRERG